MSRGLFRYWFATINNPGPDPEATLASLGATWYTGQLEEGENKTPHIQAVLYYKSQIRGTNFKEIPGWFRGFPQSDLTRCLRYCTKTQGRLAGPYSNKPESSGNTKLRCDYDLVVSYAKDGDFKKIDSRSLVCHMGNLLKISSTFSTGCPNPEVRGYWIRGGPGTGKSHYSRETFGPDIFSKAQTKWFDGY